MTDGFRKVLMIAYYFPPLGLSGVQRTAKFAKYLPKYGWKPTVLTVEPPGYYAYDESLLKEVEEAGVQIVRTKSFDANSLFRKKGVVKMPSERMRKMLQFAGDVFFIPDTKIGWKSYAVKAASDLIEREQFDLIFATAPPQTDFLIGTALKKKFALPLVVDYRDSWLDYPFKYFPTPLHRYLNARQEKKVLKAADKVIVTHRRVKETVLRRHGTVNYHDVVILPQGYDPEDFPESQSDKRARGKAMRIVHSGTFYAQRNPKPLLQAIANVFQAQPEIRGRIEVQLLGNARHEDKRLVETLGLQNTVSFDGYMEHPECARRLQQADLLYYVIDNDMQSPGKLYEYFGVRKPILASVVEGYTKQQINESGNAVCVPLYDVEALERTLVEYYVQFVQRKLKRTPEDFSSKFNRMTLTGELAKQFEFLMEYDRGAVVKVEETA